MSGPVIQFSFWEFIVQLQKRALYKECQKRRRKLTTSKWHFVIMNKRKSLYDVCLPLSGDIFIALCFPLPCYYITDDGKGDVSLLVVMFTDIYHTCCIWVRIIVSLFNGGIVVLSFRSFMHIVVVGWRLITILNLQLTQCFRMFTNLRDISVWDLLLVELVEP